MKSIVYIGMFCLLTLTVVDIHGDPIVNLNFQPLCPINEEFKICGSACPPMCSDLFFLQKPKICTLQCVSGCFCKRGFYRAKSGKCVRPEACCTGLNEYYTFCGTACPSRCNYEADICVAMCVAGCFCKEGFVRKENVTNSPCIDPDDC